MLLHVAKLLRNTRLLSGVGNSVTPLSVYSASKHSQEKDDPTVSFLVLDVLITRLTLRKVGFLCTAYSSYS